MNAKELLCKQTHEAFAGNDEMSLKVALRRLSQAEAAWQPNRETASIEQIVHHVAACKVMYCKQAFGDCSLEDDVPVGDLGKTLDWLDRAQQHLTECLEAIAVEDLASPVPTRFHGESAAHLFWILLMHDLCHGGQIQIVRREYRSRGRPVEIAEAAESAPAWRVASGQWDVDGAGRFVGQSPRSAYLYRAAEHADDLRVTATMQAVEGIEITVWMCGSPEKTELDGYTLAVSTERAKLQRQGEDVVSDPSVTIHPGRDYVLAFERRGATLRGFLDRSPEPFIEWTDPDPLRGKGHRTLGFYVWDGTIAVSDVELTELIAPAQAADRNTGPPGRK